MFGSLLFGVNDLPLDFTNVLEVLVELRDIFLPQTLGEALDALRNAVENAGVLIQLQLPLLFGRSITAEHPLEDDARIQFHRQRLSRCPPGEGAHIGTEIVARATPQMAGVVFGRELHRWKCRVAADFLRYHLVDRCIQL